MKDLFLGLIDSLNNVGDIKEANLYRRGDFSSIVVKVDKQIYKFTISKEESDGNDND